MEKNSFENIFSRMVPLGKRVNDSKALKANERESFFRLSVQDGEPFLEIISDVESEMSGGEERLYRELLRLSKSDDFFGVAEEIDLSKRVSLWEAPYLLHMMTGLKTVESPEGSILKFSDLPVSLVLKITCEEGSETANVNLCLRVDDTEKENLIFLDDNHVLSDDTVFEVKSIGLNYPHVKTLSVPVERKQLEPYLTLYLTFFDNIIPELNGNKAVRSKTPEQAVPTLYLEKVAADKALYMRTGISLDSLGDALAPGIVPTVSATIDENTILVRKVEECEIEPLTDKLEEMILSSAPDRNAKKEVYREGNFFIVPEETAGPFLLNRLHQVLEEFRIVGSEKLREYKVVAAKPKLKLHLSSGIDFLEGDAEVEIGDNKFSLADLLNQYSKQKYVKLSDGNRGIIDEGYIQKLQRLFNRRDKNGKIKVNIFNLPEVEEMLQSKISGTFAQRSRKVLEGFNNLRKETAPKYKVDAMLRPYQDEGVKWLKYLYDNNLGGCLADDMGLGKTLQTIALLSLIYPNETLPSLIVMPRSLLFNWEKELDRFAPNIIHKTYYGPDRNLEYVLDSNVILTTYGMIRNDIMTLKDLKFKLVVLDESQNIKNHSAQTTMAVQLLEAEHRLALSGTPLENNLTELYSLFRFLNPTMFGSLDDFNSSYTYPIQKYGDKDATISLRKKIFPFILRRLKKEVLKDLPPRIDAVRYVEMSEKQAKFYNERRIAYLKQIDEAIAREGVQKSQFMMLQAIGELRRIASVPASVGDNNIPSPKIDELMNSLEEAVSNGHKSVVFFNFLAGLEIMTDKLSKAGIEFETMTGATSTSERKRVVERFQNDPDCMVMLMTLKVGGVGINLTAADTVYLFEPWWNKAEEDQAISRLHRMGQLKTVNAFSLITVDTIEEKILQLQQQKTELINNLISADGTSSKHLSEEDIHFILS